MDPQHHVGVDAWIAMFRDIGLSEADMRRWHGIFESRHPAGHQHFLEWLGLPVARIEQVRRESRGGGGEAGR